MNTLLHWATGTLRPSISTRGKGEPVATTARPSVQRARSEGSASERDVGLERGKMIGARCERHVAHDRLRERSGGRRQADQDRRRGVCDDLGQAGRAAARPCPTGERTHRLRVGALLGAEVVPVIGE